jgi:hypothetical protein
MQSHLKNARRGAAVLTIAALLVGVWPIGTAFAQTAAPASVVLSESTVKALQEALNKQGITVKIDGVLTDDTRAGIRKYQSQHHLPVTGETDKATLDKLGVRQSATTAQSLMVAQATPSAPPAEGSSAQVQAPSSPAESGQMQAGMMTNCPMMQGQMQGMMQMMQGMMQMMQMMQGQMQPGQPGPMQPRQMQPGQMPGSPMQPKQN